MGYDRMLLRYAYHKPFSTKFPDKCEWQNGFNPKKGPGPGPRPIKALGLGSTDGV
jgi:hypothetical protein